MPFKPGWRKAKKEQDEMKKQEMGYDHPEVVATDRTMELKSKASVAEIIEIMKEHGKQLHLQSIDPKLNLSPKDREKLSYTSIAMGEMIKCLIKYVNS